MNIDHEKPTPAHGSLGWLEQLYFQSGNDALMKAVDEALPEAKLHSLHVIRSGTGPATVRPEILHGDGIAYSRYNPPALWAAPFSLLRVSLQNVAKEDTYVFHHGEELVLPTTGSVTYAFFWSPGGRAPKRELARVEQGTIAAINCRLPHHGWASNKAGAEAWIAIYHDPDSSNVLDLETKAGRVEKDMESRRRVRASNFDSPGNFALVAWGIADKIRTQRQRAGFTIAQLAKLAGLDASYVSKLENADTNIPLETMLHICKLLRINIEGLIGSSRWNCRTRKLPESPSEAGVDCLIADEKIPHFLHPSILDLSVNSQKKVTAFSVADELVSWIVLSGKMILEPISLKSSPQELTPKAEFLEAGSVVHFRKRLELQVRALESVRVLRIALARERSVQ